VDCSDREVNIKILLNEAVADGDMTEKQRNRLLMDMTDEVAEQVLQGNYRQNQALSLMEYTAVARFNDYARLIGFFEKHDVLDRELEGLPSDETLHERQAKGLSLTRVELSVLLSYAKIHTYQKIMASDVPEDKSLGTALERYFPVPIQQQFLDRMPGHRLQREIITNQLTNMVVNRMGATFVHQMEEKTGSDAPSIVKSFTWARRVFDMAALWKAIEALDNKVSTQVQMDMMTHSKWLVERVCQWLLGRYRTPWEMGEMAQRFTTDMQSIKALLPKVLMKEDRRSFSRQLTHLTKKGVPKKLAQQLAGMPALVSAPDIVEVAASSGDNVERVAQLYFMLGEELQLSWLRDRSVDLPRTNYWQTRARAALRDEFYHQVRVLTARSLNQIDKSKGPTAQLRGWREKHAPMLEHWNHLISEMKSAGKQDHEMLSVVIQELRDIVCENEVTS